MSVSLFRVSSLIWAFVTIVLTANSLLGCLTPGSVIGGIDRGSYVFLGKVTGYKSGAAISGNSDSITGLAVQITGKVFPKQNLGKIVVFPTRRKGDCSKGGLSKSELVSNYPIGAEIRAIARPAKNIWYPSIKALVLEAGFLDHTFISLNPAENASGRSTLDEEFDYSGADESFLSSAPARYYFVAFEVQKDLARLDRSKPSMRGLILDRLRHAPHYARISFDIIEATYTLSAPTKQP